MIVFFTLLALALVGYLTTKTFFSKSSFIETFGYTLFFSILIVPLITTILNFVLGIRYRLDYTLFISILLIIVYIIRFKMTKTSLAYFLPKKIKSEDIIVLFILLIIIIFSYLYYNNSIYYLSLVAYTEKGESNCFYMLTFALQQELNRFLATDTVYNILSTPSNSIFTASFHTSLGADNFKIMYIVFQALMFLFMFLLVNLFVEKYTISIITALFSIFNPYLLSIEMLDRNFLALVVLVILFYTLFNYKDKIFLHGLLFGVVSGLGIRFMPLMFIIPILIYYFSHHKKFKDYTLFLSLFLIVFCFNIPHLRYYGLNSLGETKDWISLGIIAFTEWLRTPFMPYPNIFYYLINIMRHFGYIVSSIMILGTYFLYKKSKIKLLISSSIFILPFLTLSIQRGILESEKNRIMIISFLGLYTFFAYGIFYLYENIVNKKKLFFKTLLSLIIITFLLFSFVNLITRFNFAQDNSVYNNKLLYQRETQEYYSFLKGRFSEVGILPGYDLLGNKLNILKKRNEEESIVYNILNKGYLQDYKPKDINSIEEEVKERENDFFNATDYVTLRIDFERLLKEPNDAVSISNENKDLFINFQNKKDLLDIYYKELNVSWQQEILPLTIFPMTPEVYMMNKIYLDLNSFISYGTDEMGFEKVNSINYYFYKNAYDYATKTGILALPSKDNNPEILIRIPINSKVVIRNWFINGANAQPFKIDGWIITLKEGIPSIKFYYNEPESYI